MTPAIDDKLSAFYAGLGNAESGAVTALAQPRQVPVDDFSWSEAAVARAELADGSAWTDGLSDGGPFELRLETGSNQATKPASAITVSTADEADALIVLLMGARHIAFGSAFDGNVITRS
jgi:hypothetical protein